MAIDVREQDTEQEFPKLFTLYVLPSYVSLLGISTLVAEPEDFLFVVFCLFYPNGLHSLQLFRHSLPCSLQQTGLRA